MDLPAGAARLHRAIRIYSKIALIAFGLLAPDLALAQAQRPTATDVFQLRNECAKLGKEFQTTFKETATGAPMSYNTNYHARRCDATSGSGFPASKGGDNRFDLYDGQTRALIDTADYADPVKPGYLDGHPECIGAAHAVKCFSTLLGVDLL